MAEPVKYALNVHKCA